MSVSGNIYGINGPIITIKGNLGFKMSEMVYVGKDRLVGEVIGLNKEETTIQVFEETTGLRPGELVEGAGKAISVTLAPGIITNIFDGIERPLQLIGEENGAYIPRGVNVDLLDKDKKWETTICVKPEDVVGGGSVIAEVPETPAILHKIMVPPEMDGTVVWAAENGMYTIEEPLVRIQRADGIQETLTMTQQWPIRIPRPIQKRYPADRPLVTGQRILDTLFPIAKGGTAAIPGGFGTGKTMTQHQLA